MLLLARAANDAAEPWGFSNFCIVAHPCAGQKKSRKTAAPIAYCYGCQRRNGGSRNELHSGFSPRRTKKASSPLQYVLRNRRKIHRYSAIKRMLCRRCQAIGEFLKPYASVLVDELPIGGLGRSARHFPRTIGQARIRLPHGRAAHWFLADEKGRTICRTAQLPSHTDSQRAAAGRLCTANDAHLHRDCTPHGGLQ